MDIEKTNGITKVMKGRSENSRGTRYCERDIRESRASGRDSKRKRLSSEDQSLVIDVKEKGIIRGPKPDDDPKLQGGDYHQKNTAW